MLTVDDAITYMGLEKFRGNILITRLVATKFRVMFVYYDSVRPGRPVTYERIRRHRRVAVPWIGTKLSADTNSYELMTVPVPPHLYKGNISDYLLVPVDIGGDYLLRGRPLSKQFTESVWYSPEPHIMISGKNLKRVFNQLYEFTLKGLKQNAISGNQQKFYKDRWDNGTKTGSFLKGVRWNSHKNKMLVMFKTNITYDSMKTVFDQNMNTKKVKQYSLMVELLGVNDYLGTRNEFFQKSKTEQIQGVRQALNSCEVRVWSNSPDFYWQGSWEGLDRYGASIYPFKGTHGKDQWIDRHFASGGLEKKGLQLGKHWKEVLNIIFTNADMIAKFIREGE